MNNAFMTLHDVNYKENSYLYHYCSLETATRIIYHNNLKFNNIYNLNDTTEYKPKIIFSKNDRINDSIRHHCRKINEYIKICCFTLDNTKIKRFPKTNDAYFTDYTGRGFAFPRMWAQYGANNKGACFIINKERLETAIEKRFDIIGKNSISYVERYKCFKFNKSSIATFKDQVLSRTINDSTAANKFFKSYPDYIQQNYFTKLSDWKDENEYRIALFSPLGETLAIEKFIDFVDGIVIGENIDAADEAILNKLLQRPIPIKKIIFNHRIIALK